ncbi:MAG: ABC transporter substrate-binding protein [Bacteroidaceae bacterium]|nr:ABC transporter substrate-binding protein [Bacteroidaceae bacterium]
MKKFLLSVQIVTLVLLLSACGGRSKTSSAFVNEETIPLKYAENLTLIKGNGYTEARLRNPWDTTRILRTYILVDKDKEMPNHLPEGTIVRTPLSNALVYTGVHCALIKELGAVKSIGGICELQYIKVPEIQEGCQNGTIVNAGEGTNPNIEKIIDMHPDALLLSPYENSGGHGQVEKLKVPIIECADYMETSALGSAEWIRFYGLLFHQSAKADSIFTIVEKNYNELKELAASQSVKPKVMCELKSGSAWYVPGGRSTTGKLYKDAGGDYVFDHYPNSGAVPLSFETVFDKAQEADVWVMKYNQPTDKTLSGIREDYSPYTRFKAYQQKKVYGCNTAYRRYYEDFPFHPDLVLKDLIRIFHPSLLPDYELKYFSNLAE